ncbi:folate-sensitive fragile site protein Fra10Ac1, partial [Infundibulicybe gibba]
LYPYGSSSKRPAPPGKSEFEILKESHKFLRDENEKDLSWDQQLASKYYATLYREFAVCDLKHYKSGNFALRWRTEDEVLSGAGETTCGNTRCVHHDPPRHVELRKPSLTTIELPFVYSEQGETKSALVKTVLCSRCLDKLMWKRRKEREK